MGVGSLFRSLAMFARWGMASPLMHDKLTAAQVVYILAMQDATISSWLAGSPYVSLELKAGDVDVIRMSAAEKPLVIESSGDLLVSFASIAEASGLPQLPREISFN